MLISGLYRGLGEENFGKLVRGISIGKLKTYQIYEGFKVRAHLHKVNTEILRKSAPRFWARIMEGDEEFGKDLGQSVLVSHLDMIAAALNLLGVPHDNGFFAKDIDPKAYFTGEWEQRLYDELNSIFPEAILVFYINHLRWEVLAAEEVFHPAPYAAA
jgi:broad specificity phosphatase PhoE